MHSRSIINAHELEEDNISVTKALYPLRVKVLNTLYWDIQQPKCLTTILPGHSRTILARDYKSQFNYGGSLSTALHDLFLENEAKACDIHQNHPKIIESHGNPFAAEGIVVYNFPICIYMYTRICAANP